MIKLPISNSYKGYCIKCGEPEIMFNINVPFCEKHKSFSLKNSSKNIVGKYCHRCGKLNYNINSEYPLCKYCCPFDRRDDSTDEYYEFRINVYKKMRPFEREQIVPNWNYNYNSIKCIFVQQKNPKEFIRTLEIDEKLNVLNVLDNNPCNNKRIMNILDAWQVGEMLLPPLVYTNDVIYDGRHRILASLFIQIETIPVLLLK